MKKIILLSTFLFIFSFISEELSAQDRLLTASNNTKTFYQCSGKAFDEGGETGNFTLGKDYWMTICSERTYPITSPFQRKQLSLTFEKFDVGDAVINLYVGRGITNSIVWDDNTVVDFSANDLQGRTIITPFTDTSGCFTIRLNTNVATAVASGFRAKIECLKKCQYPTAALDTFFYKYDKAGNQSTRPIRNGVDTTWSKDSTSFYVSKFKSVDFCEGDSVVLVAKPRYPDNDTVGGIPTQRINTSVFLWNFGNGDKDTVFYSNIMGYKWPELGGYDLNLVVLDTNSGGCASRNTIDTRVRLARNPIKTVSPLPDMCSGTVYHMNVGYGGSTINIDSIEFSRGSKERYDSTVFIPDGPNCPPGYFEAPVTFDEFPGGSVIQSINDIKSICINMEHTFLGDLGFEIYCPNGNKVTLKFNTHAGGANMGIANAVTGDDCSPALNPQGTGWSYCFSNQYLNSARGIISGDMNSPIDSTNISDTSGYFQTPQQTGQTISTTGTCSGALCETVDLTGFTPFIGCPLNGEWKLRVIDNWGIDNGYVFWWDMELGQSAAANWEYQVPIDTVIWRGNFITPTSSTAGVIAPPIDSCGVTVFDIKIVDDFGCVWDTVTQMDVLCSPIVNLGSDISICEKMNVILDAGEPMPFGETTYIWEPGGEITQQIVAQSLPNSNSVLKYTAQVISSNGKSFCYGEDSINIIVYPSAMASFTSEHLPLEGCEPLSINLQSTSTNAATYEWIIGQTKSNEENPSFTFPYGQYDLKLKVTSINGCTDSITQEKFVNVYKSPTANFGWNPTNPYVTNATAFFVNLTTPKDPTNQYHWKVQTNKMYPHLRENVFGLEPAYTWLPQQGDNVAGDYLVTLDAYSVNNSPSGFIYECHDTISKMITIINDNLLFPTAVTPNGDGINDVFVIKNLIEGQAFPDNELSIFNRLGKRIYYKQDIRNADEFWDPAQTNSPTGTYFYKFVGHGSIRNFEKNGAVELLR